MVRGWLARAARWARVRMRAREVRALPRVLCGIHNVQPPQLTHKLEAKRRFLRVHAVRHTKSTRSARLHGARAMLACHVSRARPSHRPQTHWSRGTVTQVQRFTQVQTPRSQPTHLAQAPGHEGPPAVGGGVGGSRRSRLNLGSRSPTSFWRWLCSVLIKFLPRRLLVRQSRCVELGGPVRTTTAAAVPRCRPLLRRRHRHSSGHLQWCRCRCCKRRRQSSGRRPGSSSGSSGRGVL